MRVAARIGLAAMSGLFVTPVVNAQTAPAGVSGSSLEPWQEGGVAAGETSSPTLAQTIAAMPKNIPRAAAPDLGRSIRAAQAAVKACKSKGANVSVIVTDAVGEPVVLLSGDGAGVRSQLIARTKANIVVRYGEASGAVAEKAKTDPNLTVEAAADPAIGVLRGGGFPILRGGRLIGVIAVSGGSLGGDLLMDERCAKVGLDKLDAGG